MNRPAHASFATVTLMAAMLALYGGSPSANPVADLQAGDKGAGVIMSSTGGGYFLVAGFLEVKFSMSANQRTDGSAYGHFRHEVTFQGLPVAFAGTVTCVTVDPDEGRAWIGGIITENDSEHPAFTGEVNQPGRDIWFRVLDSGEGQAEPDRSTFVGFEGNAGIITSQEYCDLQIWPDDNARTSPVTQGDIQIRP